MTELRDALAVVFDALRLPVLVYFLLINTSYLLLVALAATDFARHLRRRTFSGADDAMASPLTPGVSIIVPAYNEEAGIVAAVKAMLSLRYPRHEIVVVDDGSTDSTYERLRATFDLVEIPRLLPEDVPVRATVRSVAVPQDGHTPLVVIRKTNSGRSDAINVGINAASMPLVGMVDADSILDPDALLVVAKPFIDDPVRTVASGGVIRAANGCRVVAGRIVEVRMPPRWVARIQVVEYLRAFLLGRTGWSRLRALILISGAFGLFRRDVVVAAGGLDPDCIGEDFELVMRLHAVMREQRRDYRVTFVAEPVSWTEVPNAAAVLARQRRRWHRGLWEVLWKYRRTFGNPRYGRIGILAVPYYWLFELLAPVLELLGLILIPLGLATGLVGLHYAVELMLAAYAYALLITLAALCIEEFSFHRYQRWGDLVIAVLACVGENLGYRQLTAWWRVQGLVAALAGRKQVWGTMTREGFGIESEGSAL
jgi:cellulose synthase/poly-beta-1,6-N-acetylglucosamine synthase-like glycosyltransferase